jgi:hypothetical protein
LTRKIRSARNKAYKKGKPSYRYLDHLLRKVINKNKRAYIESTINKLDASRWWCMVNKVSGKLRTTPTSYEIDDNCYSAPELAEKLNSYFASVGGELTEVPSHYKHPENTTPIMSVPESLVERLLLSIDTKKATHSDDFPSWGSKDNADIICRPLTNIINCMLQQNKFPKKWKMAEIVPVPKTKDPTSLKDYRPISLLHHCSKIAEKVFAIEYKNQVLPKLKTHQFAYQQGISTYLSI